LEFTDALNIVQMFVAIALILVVLLQAKGSGFGSALGGSSSSVYRTRRGVEKTLFQSTIVLVVVFISVSIMSVLANK